MNSKDFSDDCYIAYGSLPISATHSCENIPESFLAACLCSSGIWCTITFLWRQQNPEQWHPDVPILVPSSLRVHCRYRLIDCSFNIIADSHTIASPLHDSISLHGLRIFCYTSGHCKITFLIFQTAGASYWSDASRSLFTGSKYTEGVAWHTHRYIVVQRLSWRQKYSI